VLVVGVLTFLLFIILLYLFNIIRYLRKIMKLQTFLVYACFSMGKSFRVDWSPKKRSSAVTLRREGYSYREIAARLDPNMTPSGIRKLCLRFDSTGSVSNQPGKGRKRCTTVKTDRRIVRMALKNRRITSGDINETLQSTGVNITSRTVRNRLIAGGLRARIPRRKPYLNAKQRAARVQWAKQHVLWEKEDWEKVLFSDEVRVSIFGSDGVRYVRRRVGEASLPECTIPTMKHPLTVMVWGCMSRNRVGRLQILEGTVNADKYISAVLEPKLLSSARDIFGQGEPFTFQQDDAPCHTAKKCMNWFKAHHVSLLQWPGNSPDLNPIENLWVQLKRLVAKNHPSNKQELISAIISAWFHVIDSKDLAALVDSMPARCQAVIDAKGFPTRY